MKEKFLKRNAIGIDEVGRGAIAGPVVAAAVLILVDKSELDCIGIDDSKSITQRKREKVNEILIHMSLNGLIKYGIGVVSEVEIDETGIVASTNKAMKIALEKLDYRDKLILVDGIINPFNKDDQLLVETMVKGDEKCYNIAAASIIAKVFRDRLMVELSKDHLTCYNWEKNKGYGSAEHIKSVKIYGMSKHHRKSFCKNFIYV